VPDFCPVLSIARSHYSMPRLNLHGELLVDGKWTGIMGMLTDGNVDASCTDLTMTTPRVNVVDFIEPVWTDRYAYRRMCEITCPQCGEYYPHRALW